MAKGQAPFDPQVKTFKNGGFAMSENRSEFTKVGYTQSEKARLKALSDFSGLSIAAYQRFSAIGPTAEDRLPHQKNLIEVVTELRRIGVLLNQIAKAVNSGKIPNSPCPGVEELGDLFENASLKFKREIQHLKRDFDDPNFE
jgi:hypothetical protein